MAKKSNNQKLQHKYKLPKSPTGIKGLDSITDGGLPKGRSTLVAGSAGSGKTILGLEYLIHGAIDYDEAGVFMAFEETEEDLKNNVKSLSYDLQELIDEKKIYIDHVKIERNQIEETGRI
jgi:circadian clock protein KaiC